MIQFNLLPDVKINYLKARAFKRRILSISLIVSFVSVAVVLSVFIYQLGQKKNIKDLTNDIKNQASAISSNEEINKILTIQNQVNTLPALHADKPVTSRMFEYLTKITPADITIQQFDVDVDNSTITISGSAPSLEAANVYIDTLKFSTYVTAGGQEGKPFASVASTLGRSTNSTAFQMTVVFDPVIISGKDQVTLTVPTKITTRSETEKPTQLFQESEEGGQ